MSARTTKTADFGKLRTDIASTIVKCKSPDSFVTRIDIQTNQGEPKDWDSPYVSGYRVYCNDNSPPQPLNWNKPANGNRYNGIDGKPAKDGIKDLVVSHKQYINLVGYGTETMLGTFKDVNLWQQAAQQDYNQCLLVGIECTYVAWLDGCRAHFSCPPAAPQPNAGAGTVDPAASSAPGGFPIGAFAGGMGAGLVVAAALLGLLVFFRTHKAADAETKGKSPQQEHMLQQQQMPVVAADPYNAVLNNGPSPASPQAQQYGADVHVMSPHGGNVGHQQMDSNKTEEWQRLPKP